VSILNPLFDAVAWVMMQIHAGLAVPFGASSGLTWALSIIILVVLMRLIMLPLFIKQVKSQRKMQAHMPQLRELQKRYKGDKQRQQEEMMKFYKENGINPLGGCLPLVAQLPVFWSLFNVLKAIADWVPGHAPQYGLTVAVVESAKHAKVFGALLSDKVLFTGTLHVPLEAKIVIVLFVAVSSTTTFLTMRQSQKRGMLQQPTADPDNPAANMQKYMMYISPLFALTGLYWQFGLVIYWVTTNIWTLGQQHFLFRNLPIVGSTTAGSSTAPASPAAGSKGGTAKSGTAARSGTARPGAKPGAAAKPGAGRPGAAKTSSGTKPATVGKPAGAATAGKPAGAAKAGGAPRNGSPVRTGAATRTGAPAKAETAADTAADASANGQSAATAKPSANGKTSANSTTVRPAAKETVQDTSSASGARSLLRFGRGKAAEPEPEQVEETRVVRQQPVRQARSKRSGKR
jgi:YidC/Oxa1 family membrane protein insertase